MAVIETPPSVGDLVRSAAAELAAAGIAEPRREALRIWAGIERVGVAEAVLRREAPADHGAVRRFEDAVHRRAAGEPLAYVTGWMGFRRLTLNCDRRALIPRPETEGLIDAALARVRTGVAADIGTGTGALALALGDEGGFERVVAVDVSPDALALAGENAAATGIAVLLRHGDLVAPLTGQLVDLLVSNPPYLTQAEYDSLDRSVRDYEPGLALVAGDDGLLFTRRLLSDARSVVAADGWIAVEVDCSRAAESGRIATALGWQGVTVLDDMFGRARYLLARQGSIA
jgi:release factor glutamine methyltransferase